jgi:hypothetical protein
VLGELELPHAARPNVSNAQLKSAPILFLITTSPLAGLSLGDAPDEAPSAEMACQGQSFQPLAASM